MKNHENHDTHLLPILLAFVLSSGIIVYTVTYSGDALALNNQTAITNSNDSSSSSNWSQTINLGKPIYFEKYVISENKSEPFPGNATLMDKNVIIVNSKTTFTHPNNNTIFIKGNAQLTTKDENMNNIAPYAFYSLGHYNDDGSFAYKGVAFFSSNATGKLSMLSDMVGIYKGETKPSGEGDFIMWKVD